MNTDIRCTYTLNVLLRQARINARESTPEPELCEFANIAAHLTEVCTTLITDTTKSLKPKRDESNL